MTQMLTSTAATQRPFITHLPMLPFQSSRTTAARQKPRARGMPMITV